ncbi:MAG: hydroxymethylglutaryl-CoA lyase [Leptospira sp.]|nr:hydroxymethylglutaryl-CoA lyase [Leptospira sp.]
MKGKVKITEVGPRDGLQNEKKAISTAEKLQFIRLLTDAGVKNIEVTSFVKPGMIPQLSDASELSEKINFQNGINYAALTPNRKGYESAIKAGFREIAVFTAASDSFTKKNINRTIDESIEIFRDISVQARVDGIRVRGYVSTVIYCPYEGKISPEKVLYVVNKLSEQGIYEISLGETIGAAVPEEVDALLELLLKHYKPDFFAGHFHDTFGMAIANVQKSIEAGIRSFDSSGGGLGGCPYAPGAAGNVATEDLVYLLEHQGFETGMQLEKLIEASIFIEKIIGRDLNSKTYLAQKSKALRC